MRRTKQRDAIRKVMKDTKRPLSPEEILGQASRLVPGLGIATVYRNVRVLTEEGFLKAVELPGQQARYELASLGHHHHFHCVECSKVYDVHACPGNLDKMTPPGFSVEGHSITLYGSCPDC